MLPLPNPRPHPPPAADGTPSSGPALAGTRVERRRPAPVLSPSGEAPRPADNGVLARAPTLHDLAPDDRRLVVLCCALRGHEAPDLLKRLAPEQAASALAAGEALGTLGRPERLALLARSLAFAPVEKQVSRLALSLSREPAWVTLLAGPAVPAAARRSLPGSAPFPRAAHPALQSWVRRLLHRVLEP